MEYYTNHEQLILEAVHWYGQYNTTEIGFKKLEVYLSPLKKPEVKFQLSSG